MKLQSTADGLKAVKNNPFDKVIEVFEDGEIQSIDNPEWWKFEKSNPMLDLTAPMPGNTVFEGVEVWQYCKNGIWAEVNEKEGAPMYETRQAYQPLEVKEQVREEAQKQEYDVIMKTYEANPDCEHCDPNPCDKCKVRSDWFDFWKNTCPDVNSLQRMWLIGFAMDNEIPAPITPKASNPELGLTEKAIISLHDTKMPTKERLAYLKGADFGYQQATQHQGLVSLADVEKVIIK